MNGILTVDDVPVGQVKVFADDTEMSEVCEINLMTGEITRVKLVEGEPVRTPPGDEWQRTITKPKRLRLEFNYDDV